MSCAFPLKCVRKRLSQVVLVQTFPHAWSKLQSRVFVYTASNTKSIFQDGVRTQNRGRIADGTDVVNVGRFIELTSSFAFAVEVPLAPTYLVERLASALLASGELESQCLAKEVASKLLAQVSLVVAELASSSSLQAHGLLEGLLDLSSPHPTENPRRAVRRRLHQAMRTLVHNFVLDPKLYLNGVGAAAQDGTPGLRNYAEQAIKSKHELRRLCKLGVPFSTVPPRQQSKSRVCRKTDGNEIVQASSAAAGVHSLKQWNRNFHEWCANTARHYFLLDPLARKRWISNGRAGRSRVTILTQELRNMGEQQRKLGKARLSEVDWEAAVQKAAAKTLPAAGSRLRLLDVGSCSNYFGREHSEDFDVTALDLVPGHPSVFSCDFLKLDVGDPESAPKSVIDPTTGAKILTSLPARAYDVAIVALLLSVLPDSNARGLVMNKIRQLLRAREGHGLLIVADTAGTVGCHSDPTSRSSEWVRAVKHSGFHLACDPQMHLSRLWEKQRGGFPNRAFCWSFLTSPYSGRAPPFVPFSWELTGVQARRQRARKQRKELASAARNGSINARRQLRKLSLLASR